jgi:hypothetical protein
MCHLEEAGFCGMCSGEGSLFMTKQLRLQQGIVQGEAVHRHERSVHRRLIWWIYRATISFPVPLSPSKLHPSAYGGSAGGRSQERTD